jgi:oxygen-independent coproporphyrinogen-3 oxidase
MGRFILLPDAEASVEIDPRVTTREQLALLRDLGFNRLSIGAQDFTREVQSAIGRGQSLEVTRAVVDEARRLGFGAINLDLVYGLPRQTEERWARTLAAAVALAPDRLAVYSFAYVPGLRPQQRRLPLAELATGGEKLQRLLMAHATLTEAGYQAIGMDHFARAEDELAKAQARGGLGRNFQGYTVRAAEDVVALGATAISDLGGALFAQNAHDLRAYGAAVQQGRLATARGLALTDDDRRRRAVIARLMCDFRVPLSVEERAHFAPELEALAPLARDGLVEVGAAGLEVTPLGRLFVRNVAMVFDAHLAAGGPTAASRTV